MCLGFDELQFKDFKEFNCVQQPPPVVIMECVCVGKKTLFFIIHCFFIPLTHGFLSPQGLRNKPKKTGHVKPDLIDVDLVRGEECVRINVCV